MYCLVRSRLLLPLRLNEGVLEHRRGLPNGTIEYELYIPRNAIKTRWKLILSAHRQSFHSGEGATAAAVHELFYPRELFSVNLHLFCFRLKVDN